MIKPIESEHDRIKDELAEKLRNSGQYKHVWTNIHYSRERVNGEIDILAQRQDGMIQLYEIKVNSARITKAKSQYDRFRRIFKRPTIGYIVSNDYIRRL